MSSDDSEPGKPEPDFETDLEETQAEIEAALNHLTNVKAYTLTGDELADFKAAQYALRNLLDYYGKDKDVAGVYETEFRVIGDEEDYKR